MGLRLLISRLASADVRRSAARALALLTVAGFILTMIVLAASGRALNLWLFVLLVWALFIYIPLRILLEAAQTLAPALRQRLGAEGHRGARRRATRPEIELTVDTLLELEVVMPRIATPREAGKARDGVASRPSGASGKKAPASAAFPCHAISATRSPGIRRGSRFQSLCTR